MAISSMLLLAIFTALFSAVDSEAVSHSSLHSQLQDAELKLLRLESTTKEYDDRLNAKSQYTEGIEKKLGEMTFEIDRLKASLSSFKDKKSHENKRLTLLEEEVQSLWAASRENNFEIHQLTLSAQEAEERLKDVSSKVEKMASIVNEQWIQIQHLEQAAQLAEIRVSKVKSELRYGKCPFTKFITNLSRHQKSYLSQALHQFERIFAATKRYHYQLQRSVKQFVEKYDFPMALADDEVVFLVASALVVFPIFGALIFLMSHLN